MEIVHENQSWKSAGPEGHDHVEAIPRTLHLPRGLLRQGKTAQCTERQKTTRNMYKTAVALTCRQRQGRHVNVKIALFVLPQIPSGMTWYRTVWPYLHTPNRGLITSSLCRVDPMAGPDPAAPPDPGVHHYRGQLSHGLHVPAGKRHRLHQVSRAPAAVGLL